jgi:site-specific recombinase XerD
MATLVWTDPVRKNHSAIPCSVPVLFDQTDDLVPSVSAWLRFLALEKKVPKNTLKQSANTIRNFWEHLEQVGRDAATITDGVLSSWYDRDIALGRKKGTCNAKLGAVLGFLVWANEHGEMKGIVGTAALPGQPQPPVRIIFRTTKKGRRVIVSHIRERASHSPRKPVPTEDQINDGFLQISIKEDPDLAERNALMLNMTELTGMRESELVDFRVSSIPDWPTIDGLVETDSFLEVTITGKGGKARSIPFVPELLISSRDYREGARARALEKCGAYDPGTLFISHSSGKPLAPKSVSNLFSGILKKSGSTHHRVRARFLQRIVDLTIEEEIEKNGFAYSRASVLLRAADLAGHAGTSTLLAHYVDVGLKTRKGRGQTLIAPVDRSATLDRLIKQKLERLRSLSVQG